MFKNIMLITNLYKILLIIWVNLKFEQDIVFNKICYLRSPDGDVSRLYSYLVRTR